MNIYNKGTIITGHGNVNAGNFMGGSDPEFHQNNYNNSNSIPLSEVAEIQKLLEKLEELNPTATVDEQVLYINKVSPSLARRWKTALKDGSETAIDEFLLENKFLKVTKAFLMGLLQPN